MVKVRITLILFCIMQVLVGCSKDTSTLTPKSSPYENEKGVYIGYNYNNQGNVSEIINEIYSLEDLYKYFGYYTQNENQLWNIERFNEGQLEIDTVNKFFKIECLRHSELFTYSVYKVKEGGYFYLFWGVTENKIPVVTERFYINKLKDEKDFSKIKLNKKHTFEDVKKIDPSLELLARASSGPYSYSLLKSGKLLQFKYKLTENNSSNIVLEVRGRSIVDKDNSQSSLARIMDKDIPQQSIK